jgi:Uncharacterized conserved protein
MKRIALFALVLVLGPTLCLGAQGGSSWDGRVVVSGEGSVEVEPTIAYVQLGVDSFDASAMAAVAANHVGMEAVIAALRSAGIAAKDIKTAGYSLSLQQGEAQAVTVQEAAAGALEAIPRRKDQYIVTNSLMVSVRDLSRLGAIVDSAVGSGATHLYGISFGAEDTSAAEKEARAQAMKAAAARAEELAALAGRKVGRVLRVSDSGPAMSSYVSGRPRMLMADLAGGLNFNPGQVPVTVRVDVEYELR